MDLNSNATELLFCFTEHQSLIRMAKEEGPKLADGLGKATNVQPGLEARAENGGLISPLSRVGRPSLFVLVSTLTLSFLDRRYRFFPPAGEGVVMLYGK